MADRSGLGVVGYIFGGVTALVMMTAFGVVFSHIESRQAPVPAITMVQR